jgi:hypothetical protein
MESNETKKRGFASVAASVESLAPYKQLFLVKKADKLLSKDSITELFGHAEKLDMGANAALQALLFVSAMLVLSKASPQTSSFSILILSSLP